MADIFDGYRPADAGDEMFTAPCNSRPPYDSSAGAQAVTVEVTRLA
jgi:hypothetical protein